MPRLAFASTKDSDMRYAIRMEIPDPFFLLETGDRMFVFLDHREYGVFQEQNQNPSIELVLLNPLMTAACAIPGNESIRCKLAFHLVRQYGVAGQPIDVPTGFPLDIADYLRANRITLHPIAPYAPARLQKTDAERDAIRDGLRRTHVAFRRIEEMLRASIVVGEGIRFRGVALTSESVKREVDAVLLAEGMQNREGIIVSCGAHAAIPHHSGHGLLRPEQTIICDIFPRSTVTGYFADMTRTYVKGAPSPDLVRMYDAVRTAQARAIAAVRPGVMGKDVHAVSCETFREAGYDVGDRGFIHGTGHGLGLDVHEEPYIAATSSTVLASGHVVTVEPGLYYPELGGVRLEDVVVVTETGCENLTEYPTEFVIP